MLAETYPRACYAIALQPGHASTRRIMPLAKTQPQVRAEAIRRIQQVERTRTPAVTVHDWDAAAASEDDFDACVTALALLRATLDQSVFRATALEDPRVEGGILGVGALALTPPPTSGTP